MTKTQKWALLKAAPENLLIISNPEPEMEAYALRRRPYLIFDRTDWKVDPEHVCPGISAWANRHNFYAKPGKPPKCLHDSRSATSKYVANRAIVDAYKQLGALSSQEISLFAMMESAADWEHFRALAFMPPPLIGRAVRTKLRKSDFHAAVQVANEVALSHWGSLDGSYPTVDYKPSR